MARWKTFLGNCLEVIDTFEDGTIDSVITDPPYPEVDRDYGRISVDDWFQLMMWLVALLRKKLKPAGSAIFILQPNSSHVGSLRTWIYDFCGWLGAHWNIIQDAYWWNSCTPPNVHCNRTVGLMRPSVKLLVWAGLPNCYRNQDEILNKLSQSMIKMKNETNKLRRFPSGYTVRRLRVFKTANERGGTTPYNLFREAGTGDKRSAISHPASTPLSLCDSLIRYITPPNGIVLDPFMGIGTVGQAAISAGRQYVGVEILKKYWKEANKLLRNTANKTPRSLLRN